MKVTARDIAGLVKDAQVEMMRKRSAEPKDSLIDALILDEMQKMTSLLGDDAPAQGSNPEGSMSLDPSAFVDTSNWTGELLPGGATPAPFKRPTRPASPTAKPKTTIPPSPVVGVAGGGDVESLEHLLEPDRTGVHGRKQTGKGAWLLIAIVMVVLAAGAAVAVVFAMQ
jgi:hypothetical protein